MKSEAKLNNKITTEVYSYLPNGKPAGIDITSGNMQFHTSFFTMHKTDVHKKYR